MAFFLVDDGTLDTVLECTKCGDRIRNSQDEDPDRSYEDFVEACILDAEEEHDCEER